MTLVAGTVLLGAAAVPAQAQFYGGMWGGFNYVPSPTDFLNSQALIQAGRGQQRPEGFRPYANNPNSFHNRLRDNNFVPSYDVRRRQPVANRTSSTRSLGNTARAEPRPVVPAAAVSPRPLIPLLSFFDSSLRVLWPADSPVGGDLKEKRDTSDQASLAVLEETKRQQAASLSTVTDARQKLLDYGRPALQEIRAVSTTPVADAFHQFMLSLYESLAQAAAPPEYAAGPLPAP
jgi:hypothetical protein